LILGAITAALLPVAAASAATYSIEVTAITTPEPGWVTVTAATAAPVVQFELIGSTSIGYAATHSKRFIEVPPDVDEVTAQLETWGLGNGATVRVWSCESVNACSVSATETFDALDITPEVAWGEVTSLNPTESTYPVTISDTGGGLLFAVWSQRPIWPSSGTEFPDWSPLTGSGRTDLSIWDGDGTVQIRRCQDSTGPGTCGEVLAVSPPLHVKSMPWFSGVGAPWDSGIVYFDLARDGGIRIPVSFDEPQDVEAGLRIWKYNSRSQRVYVFPTDGSFDWQNVPTDGAGRATGEVTYLPSALADGEYHVELTARTIDPSLGLLEMGYYESWTAVQDQTPPASPQLSVSSLKIYPYSDGYLDSIRIETALPGEGDERVLTIVNDVGDEVYRRSSTGATGGTVWDWDGTYSNRAAHVPAGTYRLAVVVSDLAGHSAQMSKQLQVFDERVVYVSHDWTIPAARTVVDKSVGRCAALRVPARKKWPGSIGLHTTARCGSRDPAATSIGVLHGLHLPERAGADVVGFELGTVDSWHRGHPYSDAVLRAYVAGRWRTISKPYDDDTYRYDLVRLADMYESRRLITKAGDIFWATVTNRYVVSAGMATSWLDIKNFRLKVYYRTFVEAETYWREATRTEKPVVGQSDMARLTHVDVTTMPTFS
jgi:hypothetical protein